MTFKDQAAIAALPLVMKFFPEEGSAAIRAYQYADALDAERLRRQETYRNPPPHNTGDE